MKDRIPTKILANGAIRYGVYDDAGNLLRYEYIKLEDEPTEKGDPLCKATLLPDDVAKLLGLTPTNPQVKDAITLAFVQGKYVYILTVKCNSKPVSGITVSGLDIPPRGKTVTDSNGVFIGLSANQNPTVSIDASGYVDIKPYSGTVASTGDVTSAEIDLQTNTPGEITYTSSTTVKFATDVLVDVHCISGGANGTAGHYDTSVSTTDQGGDGGRGGGQKYAVNISPPKNTAIPITVGGVGGNSSAFGITADNSIAGGTGGRYSKILGYGTIIAASTPGTSITVKKYGTGINITTCSGGGGANGIGSGGGSNAHPASAGGSPYGGAGGSTQSAGTAATAGTYGNGGGGGGSYNKPGGAGTPGVVYMTWRFAA